MSKRSSDFGTKPSALFVSPEAPYPAIGGGALRAASLLEYLARHYAVHLITFREPGAPDPALAVPSGRVCRIDVLELPYHSKAAAARTIRNLSRAWRGLRQRSPRRPN